MEVFLTILRYAAGPILGALIGYLTNWLAVKMLFRPYNAKKIGKWTLPFTPGIIPKRKGVLAKAVGAAVSEQLLTKADLEAALCSEESKQRVADFAVEQWNTYKDKNVQEAATQLLGDGKTETLAKTAEEKLTNKVYTAIQNADLGGLVAREGQAVINQKKSSLGMIAMFLTDELVSSVCEKLGEGVNNYVAENGREKINEMVQGEVQKALSSPLGTFTENVEEQTVRNFAVKLYSGAVNKAAALTQTVDIAAIVQKKIEDMDMKSLEKLVMSVMKKELNAIVNLGALIGFILGIIMIFINI
jgi:uncharacterized membrane protein YheB (UPF0754 family)